MSRRNFPAFFLLTSCLVSGQSPRYVLKGQKVALKKDITGRPDNILWKHNGNKVVEFNGREEYVYDPYKTRVTLDWSSAELNITDLRLEDSGKYELEVSVNKKLEKSHHDMEVLDRVAKPTISCNISNSDNSGTLVCSAEPRQPVHLMTFEWYSQGSVHPGPHLQISLGGKLDDQVYNCTVRNPLTTETAAFTAKDCHTTKSSSTTLIVTVIVISLLLLLIVGVVILYYCKKQKGCFEKRQTDSTDLEKQKQCVTKGETAKTDETMPLIDGQPSGKSSAGGTPRSSQMPDLNDGGRSSISITASDQNRAAHQNTQSFPSSETPDATQKEDDTNIKITTVKDHFSEAPEKEEGHASNELPAEPDDVNQDASSEQKPSTLPASPGTVEDSVNTDRSDSDPKESRVPPGKATDTAAVGPDTGPAASDKNKDRSSGIWIFRFFPLRYFFGATQNKEDIKNTNTTDENRLGQASDEQEGHASNESESPAESANVNQNKPSEPKSSTAPPSPASVQNRPDHQKAEASTSSVTLADAASADDPECSTTSGLQPAQNSTSQTAVNVSSLASSGSSNQLQNSSSGLQNSDKYSSSLPEIRHPGQNEDETKKRNTVAGKLEGHASKESVSSPESANEDTSSEQNSSTAPASPDKGSDPSNTDQRDSDPKETSKDSQGKATDTAAVGPATEHDGQNEDDIKNKNTPVEDNLGQAPDEQKGQKESPAESDDQNTEQNYTTAPAPGYVKEQIKKINSNTNTGSEDHGTSI